jgi:hypothetical protein
MRSGAFVWVLRHFLLAWQRTDPTFFMLGSPPAAGSLAERFFAPVLDELGFGSQSLDYRIKKTRGQTSC